MLATSAAIGRAESARPPGARLSSWSTESRVARRCDLFFFFQAEDGIRDYKVTGVQTCALPICAAHLYPQLDEYNNVPSNTGLWSLNPTNGDLFLLDHSPSGDFNPFVDSFGRVIFTRWDHLVQDRNATDDRMSRATNGTFNFFSEATTNYDIHYRPNESFPEPRTYDTELTTLYGVQGNAMNSFFPWMQNEDGTGLEILNHIGRQELLGGFRGSSFTNDNNLVQQFSLANRIIPGTNFLNNFLHIREDPLHPGSYFGIDAPDFGTHSSGQILKLFGPPGTNGEQMT